MTTIAHSNLTGSDLHEPKGISTVPAGQVYISDGAGSGTWIDTGSTIGTSNFSTGDLKPTFKITADSGWVMCDDGTIGDLSSGATSRASADTAALYALIWTNFYNTEAAVSGGRGANAVADFAAHKTISLPKMLGRVYGVAGVSTLGGSGTGAGLSPHILGKNLGAETVALLETNVPPHTHQVSGNTTGASANHSHTTDVNLSIAGRAAGANNTFAPAGSNFYPSGIESADHFHGLNITSATGSGSSTPVTIIQPTVFLNMMVKL